MAEDYSDEDMAEVGRALMQAIRTHAPNHWHPLNCPSEIVGDLRELLDQAQARIRDLERVLCRASRCIGLQLQLIEQRAKGPTLNKLPIVRALEGHRKTFQEALAASTTAHACTEEGDCRA